MYYGIVKETKNQKQIDFLGAGKNVMLSRINGCGLHIGQRQTYLCSQNNIKSAEGSGHWYGTDNMTELLRLFQDLIIIGRSHMD